MSDDQTSNSSKKQKTSNEKKASVVKVLLVGCGAPLKSMGAYHALQILDGRVPDAELQYVVEPWYFKDAAKNTPGYDEFHAWRKTIHAKHGVEFFSSVKEVPPPTDGDLRLAIISARTADNPALLEACVTVGQCTAIYLEKPGATTVEDLEAMRDLAASKNVPVHMGFNKNVSSYVSKTRAFAKKHNEELLAENRSGHADVTFVHNNNYPNTPEALSECFERNAEGMLKNMAIHELAILVTFYGLTVDTIESVVADTEYSSLKTFGKFTDFVKLKFQLSLSTDDGGNHPISVAADRCGGDESVGIVRHRGGNPEQKGTVLSIGGSDPKEEEQDDRFVMPDDETVANIPTLRARYGDAMPYFFTQDPDYLELKKRVVRSLVQSTDAEGVASIDMAIETLKVAEYLTPILREQLK